MSTTYSGSPQGQAPESGESSSSGIYDTNTAWDTVNNLWMLRHFVRHSEIVEEINHRYEVRFDGTTCQFVGERVGPAALGSPMFVDMACPDGQYRSLVQYAVCGMRLFTTPADPAGREGHERAMDMVLDGDIVILHEGPENPFAIQGIPRHICRVELVGERAFSPGASPYWFGRHELCDERQLRLRDAVTGEVVIDDLLELWQQNKRFHITPVLHIEVDERDEADVRSALMVREAADAVRTIERATFSRRLSPEQELEIVTGILSRLKAESPDQELASWALVKGYQFGRKHPINVNSKADRDEEDIVFLIAQAESYYTALESVELQSLLFSGLILGMIVRCDRDDDQLLSTLGHMGEVVDHWRNYLPRYEGADDLETSIRIWEIIVESLNYELSMLGETSFESRIHYRENIINDWKDIATTVVQLLKR